MKKVAALLISLVLMVSAVAFAEAVPSKTTDDMTSIAVVAEDGSAVSGELVVEATEDAKAELATLAEAESISGFFGDIVDVDGNAVKLVDLLDAKEEELNIHEFFGLTVKGFAEECGDVVCTMNVATPYEVGSKVIVLIGQAAEDEVVWTALQGEVVETAGCVKATIPEELLLKVQNGDAMVAIVNKA